MAPVMVASSDTNKAERTIVECCLLACRSRCYSGAMLVEGRVVTMTTMATMTYTRLRATRTLSSTSPDQPSRRWDTPSISSRSLEIRPWTLQPAGAVEPGLVQTFLSIMGL